MYPVKWVRECRAPINFCPKINSPWLFFYTVYVPRYVNRPVYLLAYSKQCAGVCVFTVDKGSAMISRTGQRRSFLMKFVFPIRIDGHCTRRGDIASVGGGFERRPRHHSAVHHHILIAKEPHIIESIVYKTGFRRGWFSYIISHSDTDFNFLRSYDTNSTILKPVILRLNFQKECLVEM